MGRRSRHWVPVREVESALWELDLVRKRNDLLEKNARKLVETEYVGSLETLSVELLAAQAKVEYQERLLAFSTNALKFSLLFGVLSLIAYGYTLPGALSLHLLSLLVAIVGRSGTITIWAHSIAIRCVKGMREALISLLKERSRL